MTASKWNQPGPCRHCGASAAKLRPRGLCWRCSADAAVRSLYPAVPPSEAWRGRVTRPRAVCHCGRPAHAKGLCMTHYDRARGRHDRATAAPPCPCGRPHKAKGLCVRCYIASRRKLFGRRPAKPKAATTGRPNVGGIPKDTRPEHLLRLDILAARVAAGLPLKSRDGDILHSPEQEVKIGRAHV